MPLTVPAANLDPGIPPDVIVASRSPAPLTDPTLGIPVTVNRRGRPKNRLVTIGDSLTQGVRSGAVSDTDVSYPAIIAYELGWLGNFRRPDYGTTGGLPINIELLLRDLEGRFGENVNPLELPRAAIRLRKLMDDNEDYWERGPGAAVPAVAEINHNLGVFGWDLRDALTKTANSCLDDIVRPRDDLIRQLVENDGERAALRVLPTAPDSARSLTVFDAARRLGDDVGGGDSAYGIETLVVFLGSNNALGSVAHLKVAWSGDGYDDPERKKAFTVWRPTHFADELARVVAQVRSIRARHVIWCTVPHVTVAPIARGVGAKVEPGSRYFPHYTRPWISDARFDPDRDPHITAQQARAVDGAIDQYNELIAHAVRAERRAGRDWYVVDVTSALDRLAVRRYVTDPLARPDWWTPYRLPPELAAMRPVPDVTFLTSDGKRRATGGLFSLDGFHPTTVCYGLVAQEVINVMRRAGVAFFRPDGRTPRPDPVEIDFDRLVRRDTLIERPPANVRSGLGIIGWLDQAADILSRVVPFRL